MNTSKRIREWEGEGVYALVQTGIVHKTVCFDYVYAGSREDVRRYVTIADGRNTVYARRESDLEVDTEPVSA